jgi:hypothetical protein
MKALAMTVSLTPNPSPSGRGELRESLRDFHVNLPQGNTTVAARCAPGAYPIMRLFS